jgi:hypothetical protein
VKKTAYVKTTIQSPVIDCGESRIVFSDRGRTRGRGRRRGHGGILGQIETSACLEVPLSPATGRMLLGQVSLNSRFLSEILSTKLHFASAGELKQAISQGLHNYRRTQEICFCGHHN